jgi:hypothetical protein
MSKNIYNDFNPRLLHINAIRNHLTIAPSVNKRLHRSSLHLRFPPRLATLEKTSLRLRSLTETDPAPESVSKEQRR